MYTRTYIYKEKKLSEVQHHQQRVNQKWNKDG